MKNTKCWFITGISSGLGAALANAVIESGDFLIGTFRDQQQTDSFNKRFENRAFAITLDVTKTEEINKVYDFILKKLGKLDVLVNNAGYGLAGAIEETSDAETRKIFEANFFGTLQITQTFLPLFRSQKSGHILQISSHGGFKAFAGFGIYNASKFAVEGFSEALAAEIAPLGIKLTIIEPGPFRTNFAGSSFQLAKLKIEDYDKTAGMFRERMKLTNGNQEGDPSKAAKAIIEITKIKNPPLRLPLGKIAISTLTQKIEAVRKDVEDYKTIAETTVY